MHLAVAVSQKWSSDETFHEALSYRGPSAAASAESSACRGLATCAQITTWGSSGPKKMREKALEIFPGVAYGKSLIVGSPNVMNLLE